MSTTEQLLLSEPEAARLLGVCSKTVYHLRRAGELAYVRVGKGAIRYRPSALDEWAKANEVTNEK